MNAIVSRLLQFSGLVWLSGGGANLHIYRSTYSKWGKGVELHSSYFKAWKKHLNMSFWWSKMCFKGYNIWLQGDFKNQQLKICPPIITIVLCEQSFLNSTVRSNHWFSFEHPAWHFVLTRCIKTCLCIHTAHSLVWWNSLQIQQETRFYCLWLSLHKFRCSLSTAL